MLDLGRVVEGPPEGEVGWISRHLTPDSYIFLLGHAVHFDTFWNTNRVVLYIKVERGAVHCEARMGYAVGGAAGIVAVCLLPHLLQDQIGT